MSDSLVIIPTYNEKENIENMIRKVFSFEKDFHVLIVDDGSPDGTADIVKSLQKEFPTALHIEERSGKLGLGTAYIHGFKWALNRDYGFVFEMDADFSHNPEDLVRLYNACVNEGGALSVGSRYCIGGGVENWPWNRKLLSYYASVYVRLILGIKVKDTTAGFICYSRKVLQDLDFDKVTFKGYAFQVCMKYMAVKRGHNLIEVPIIFKDRQFGESKMSIAIFREALTGVWKMRKMKI